MLGEQNFPGHRLPSTARRQRMPTAPTYRRPLSVTATVAETDDDESESEPATSVMPVLSRQLGHGESFGAPGARP